MVIYKDRLPSSHIFLQKESTNELFETIAAKVAVVIVHEAAHKKSWVDKFALHNQSLAESFSRGTEEQFAERYEQMAEHSLSTKLNPNILWEEGKNIHELSINPAAVLTRAVQIANSLGVLPYTIHPSSVEARDLGSQQAWGLFEMVQSPGDPNYSGVAMAWDDNSKKLFIDVNSIIKHYSGNFEAVQADYQKYKDQVNTIKEINKNRLMTKQYDGVEPDVPGISSDNPLQVVAPNQAMPAVGAVPSIPSR